MWTAPDGRGPLQSSPVNVMACSVRAFLLASATATNFLGLRASKLMSEGGAPRLASGPQLVASSASYHRRATPQVAL